MKINDIYQAIIEEGMNKDPRGKTQLKNELKRIKKQFSEMKAKEKANFDPEKLTNPYSDTRILYGDPNTEVKHILVGIDLETPEILLADRLKTNGQQIDLLLAHHPEGQAVAGLYAVMNMQADILHKYGLPIALAEGLMEERIKEVQRRLLPLNHNRAVDAARLLDLPLMCAHTPADNHVASYLQAIFEKEKPERVSEVVDLLMEIPEYQESKKFGTGPTIFIGSETRRAGKVLVDMTGGTSGSKEIFDKIIHSTQIGTLVGMHMDEDHRKKAEEAHLNVIIAGHIASDTLGMNLLLDAIDRKGDLTFLACSGFKRYKH